MKAIYFILWILGIAFSLSSFAFKIALALKSIKTNFKTSALILFFYLFIFFIICFFIKTFFTFVEKLLQAAFYIHLFIAFGLIGWGIYLFIKPNVGKSFKSALVLLIPCPVCITTIAISSYLLFKTYQIPFYLAGIILGGFFIFLVMIFYFLNCLFFKDIPQVYSQFLLGLTMILIAFYLLGSFYFPAKIESAKQIYTQFNKNLNFNFLNYKTVLLIYSVLTLVLLIGFLIKGKRVKI